MCPNVENSLNIMLFWSHASVPKGTEHSSLVGEAMVFTVRLYTFKFCVCGVSCGTDPTIGTVKRDLPLEFRHS